MNLSHFVSALLNLNVKVPAQVLHFKESFIDQRLTLPRVNVSSNHKVDHLEEHLPHRHRNVIPRLLLKHISKGMCFNVHLNLIFLN